MPFLSIIVPVYNVEKYLLDCLSSISKQSFLDFEVICVDDGSTDGSSLILEKWTYKDPRFIIIQQRNKGLSGARNTGLKYAKGKYVTFLDSDDLIVSTMYEKLIQIIKEENLDLIGCCFQEYPRGKRSSFSFETNRTLSPCELLNTNKHLQSSNDLCFVWRYIVKRDLLLENEIAFNERVLIGEDMIFMTDVFMNAKRIRFIDEPFYYYRKNNVSSLMASAVYNPNLISAYSLMYQIKKEQIRKYSIDLYTPYSFDLACYTINIYLRMFFDNIFANDNVKDKKNEFKRILSLDMIKDSCKIIGFRNIYTNWKEYAFYLMIKFRMFRIVYQYFLNHKA